MLNRNLICEDSSQKGRSGVKGCERVVAVALPYFFVVFTPFTPQKKRTQNKGGKSPRKHFVQKNLQNAPPNLPPSFCFTHALRSGKNLGLVRET